MPQQLQIVPYREFLDRDPSRCEGRALEIGIDWTDAADRRYRVCWYEQTHELTIERLSETEPLDLEDFHQGIETVEIVCRLDGTQLEARLGPWPHMRRCRPRTLQRLRALAASP
jgi:hypothetical protein